MNLNIYIEKEELAIEDVKRNLREFELMIDLGITNVIDRVSSGRGSLISVSNDIGFISSDSYTRAIIQEEDDICFYKKQISIIDSLDEPFKEVIVNRHIKMYKISVLRYGNDEIVGRANIYEVLREAYVRIALLDEEIDYNFNDFKVIRLQKKKNQTAIREIVKIILSKLRQELINSELSSESIYALDIINSMPTELKSIVYSYINNDLIYSSTDYKYLKKAILLFAHHHSSINYDNNQYISDLKKTGSGWKKQLKETNYAQISIKL